MKYLNPLKSNSAQILPNSYFLFVNDELNFVILLVAAHYYPKSSQKLSITTSGTKGMVFYFKNTSHVKKKTQ